MGGATSNMTTNKGDGLVDAYTEKGNTRGFWSVTSLFCCTDYSSLTVIDSSLLNSSRWLILRSLISLVDNETQL